MSPSHLPHICPTDLQVAAALLDGGLPAFDGVVFLDAEVRVRARARARVTVRLGLRLGLGLESGLGIGSGLG